MKTNRVIYRIFNPADGKSYVGQAIAFEQRKSSHFSALKQGKHRNPKLQLAYNKHELKIEILEILGKPEELNEREVYWITHFDSYHNGYNIAPGGDANSGGNDTPIYKGKPIEINGETFESIRSAAKHYGVPMSRVQKWLDNYAGRINLQPIQRREQD